MDAARNGKQVTALVELKARFDEEANVQWSRRMEEVGVHVVYGLTGLKTHCKCCLVVRREKNKLRRYAHLGTGNYNETTSKLYTDLSLMTSKKKYTKDALEFFNVITGHSIPDDYENLITAPIYMRDKILELIDKEILNVQKGKEGKICIKINHNLESIYKND